MYSLLKGQPEIGAASRAALLRDYERFQSGLPDSLEAYVQDHYKIDLSSEYGNHFIKNPFGKGSGQLSLNTSQVRRDCEEGLGFVVLKSIIAEDETGRSVDERVGDRRNTHGGRANCREGRNARLDCFLEGPRLVRHVRKVSGVFRQCVNDRHVLFRSSWFLRVSTTCRAQRSTSGKSANMNTPRSDCWTCGTVTTRRCRCRSRKILVRPSQAQIAPRKRKSSFNG